jgi:hypothetical protein
VDRDTVNDRAVGRHVERGDLHRAGGIVDVEHVNSLVSRIADEQPLPGRIVSHDFSRAEVEGRVVGEAPDGRDADIQRVRGRGVDICRSEGRDHRRSSEQWANEGERMFHGLDFSWV